MLHFYEFIKNKRIENQISLREFCRQAEIDPSNWSKTERGIADPPKSLVMLNRIAQILKLDDEDELTMLDLALIDSIPEDLKPKEDILEKLPLFFRTLRGDKPNEEELRKIIETLTKS